MNIKTLLPRVVVGLVLMAARLGAWSAPEPADTVLVHGRVVRFDAPVASALAVRGNIIVAVGSDREVRERVGPRTRVVDLGGRTVIPGLIDSHIHAIRAGLTWTTEVSWIGVRSLKEALQRIRDKAAAATPGDWLVVAGGWTPAQFDEGRGPSLQELDDAAAGHPAFVQMFYSRILLDHVGAQGLDMTPERLRDAGLAAETDTAGRPTGWITGDSLAISRVIDRLPRPTLAESIAGTRAFFRELNAVGLTGVSDPGGYNLPLSDYQALFTLWKQGGLTLRVRYSASAPHAGTELEDFRAITQLLPSGFGDDWLRFNGIGETVTWGMTNNDQPTLADRQHLADVLRWAAARGLTATFHWNNDRSVHELLDVLAQVNAATPIAPLRWSIAHLHDISLPTLAKMKALGVGWTMQDAFFFRGQAYIAHAGDAARRDVPLIGSALRLGVHVGAGTDAHRVMWFSPFVALQWMLDGKTIEGLAMRSPAEIPSRLEALRLFTEGSAWFSFDDQRRGAIAVGRLADLAVLSDDYLSVPVDRIGGIRSLLTMVDGRVVFAAGPFASFDPPAPSTP